MYVVKQSTALSAMFFAHDVAGDAVLLMVDGGFTKRISKNGAAFGAMTVVITEQENGWYSFPLSTSHSDTNGILSITFTNAACKQVNLQFRVEANLADDLAADIATRATPAQVATELGTYDGPTEAEMNARTIVSASYALEATVDTVKTETALIKTEADKIALVTAGAGVAGSVIEEVENRATPAQVATELGTYDGPTDAEMIARTLPTASYFDPAADDVDVRAIQANVITAASINAAAITAAKFGAGAVDANALAADAGQQIRDEILPTQNVAFTFDFLFVHVTDHVTPVTVATGSLASRSIDGAAFAPAGGTITEIGFGMYQFAANAADMNGAVITFRFLATGGTPGAPDDRFVTIPTTGAV